MDDRKAAANSTLAIGGVSSPLDSFVVAESSVLRTNFCAENPAFAKRQNVKGIVNNAIRQMNKLTTSLFSELNCN
jgi:hypothetical protein